MTAPTNHQFQIARSGSPSSRCLSKAARPHPSLCSGRAATIIDDQTYDGRAGGASLRFGARGCDRHAPAHRQGRVHSFAAGSVMAFSSTMTLFLPVTGRPFGVGTFPALSHIDGIGAVAAVPVANLIHNRRQRGFQAFAERLPSHSSAPAVYVPKRRRGVIAGARNTVGEIQNV